MPPHPEGPTDRFAVTVYAGSQGGAPARYLQIARETGRAIAERHWVLVYGGANIGLMGACADAALAAGGRVEGVILDTFSGVAHPELHSLEVVGSMRERKAGLAHRGDAFVALPGGFGTLEELSEILVERQLAHHQKPLILVSPEGFWGPLLAQFDRMLEAGLIEPSTLGLVTVVPDGVSAIAAIEAVASPAAPSSPQDPA